ncbi:MAG: acyltransferase family protein [Aestuariibacter sp.]
MPQPNFIPHLHAFRGFAILTIIAAHAWSFPIFWTGQLDSTGLTWLFHITETLFHGSTLYFAIISGLLFSIILKNKSWREFYRSKLLNVMLPFCIITLLMTSINWSYAIEQAPKDLPLALQFGFSVLRNIVTGQAMIQYWYIPVLAFLFVMTPLLVYLDQRHRWLFIAIVLSPLVISRSGFPDFLQPQSFAYFLGAYALGMYVGSRYQQFLNWVARYKIAITIIAMATTIIIACLFSWQYQPSGVYSVLQTLVYVQKFAVFSLMVYWLSLRESSLPNWLMQLGTYSFAIYFLHVFFMWPFINATNTLLTEYRMVEVVAPLGILNLIWSVVISMLVTWLIKLISGKYSRCLVGA